MDELRSWWEVPSIAHFCSLFRTAFELTDFDIEDLEEALLESQREEGSEFVTDLVCKLLNGCYCRKDVTVLNYDLYVKDVIKYKWDGTGNPIVEKSEFKQLSLREKVELIHAICEYRLDAEDIPELLKGYEGDNMRVEPLGKDKDGGTYWYFYGCRLYKEDPPPKMEISKEEKRAKEKQRRKELEKQRKTEKKQKKKDKRKAKTLRQAEKTAKASQPTVEPEDDGNIRRSGRLRIKKELQKVVSESSESCSSEEETDESSSSDNDQEEEIEEVEHEPEKPKKQKNCKKTPAKKTPARKTPAKKTPPKNQNNTTPSSTPRQSGRLRNKAESKTLKKTTVEQTPEPDLGIRRSGRIQHRKQSTAAGSHRNNSDSEEEVKDDVDSGHESGVTDDDDDTKSETSKISVKSTMSKSSQQTTPAARRITLPRASAHMEKRIQEENEDSDNEEPAADEESQDKEDAEKDENSVLNVSDQAKTVLCESETQKDENETCSEVENSDERKEENNSNVDHGERRNTENKSQELVENENPNEPNSVTESCTMKHSNKVDDEEMEVEDSKTSESKTSESIVINDQKSLLDNETKFEGLSVQSDSEMEDKKDAEKESKQSENLKYTDKDVANFQNGDDNHEIADITDEIKTGVTQKVERENCEIKKESSEVLSVRPTENSSSDKIICTEELESKPDEDQTYKKTEELKFDPSERKETIKGESENVTKQEQQTDLNNILKDVKKEDSALEDKYDFGDTKLDEIKSEPVCEEKQVEGDREMKEEKDEMDKEIKDEQDDGDKEIKHEQGDGDKEMKEEQNEGDKEMKEEQNEEDKEMKEEQNEGDKDKKEKQGKVHEEMKEEQNEGDDEVKEEQGEDGKGMKEEEDEDDKEIIEKEITASGPKTTLGKQKMFASTGPVVPPEPSKSNTRWHLICSTLDDWVNLAEWFSDSQSRCEKMLMKLIKDDFLPVLPEIIEAREKERRKRLQELEVRRSNRITFKMKEKMEQEKILAEALALEEKEKLRSEEERRLKEEQQRLEEENRLREERVKAREERAKRLSMREERARLIAEGKEIPPELLYTASNKYNDDYESDDSRNDLKSEEDYNNLSRLVEAMKMQKDSWPFLEAVTDEVAPGYSEVIKRPMDLSKIEEKVRRREYKSTQHFLSDFRLMFNNCKRFNGPDSEFTECARSMEQMLKKYRKKFLLDQPVEHSYYHDKDFTLKGSKSVENVKGSKSGDKRYRPRRAASSRAMETVHKALNSSEEESDDQEREEEEQETPAKRKKPAEFPAKQPSHQSLLLQEMIEMKRQREKNLASKILENNQVVTRGPERIRVGNPQDRVAIMPRDELPTQGLLKLAASREIKRKVSPQFGEMVDLTKKDPGLSVTSNTVGPVRGRGKTIKIVAPTGAGPSGSVLRDTAGTVTVSADGYLIIGGRNSGIKVSNNTKIVIQQPGASQNQNNTNSPSQGTELLVKRIPTPSGLKALPDSISGIEKSTDPTMKDHSSVKPDAPRTPAILNASISPPLYQSRGNIPSVVRQHQFLNRELNSSGVVTQNPNSLSSNLINRPLNSALSNKKQDTPARGHSQQNGSELQSTPAKVRKLSVSQESTVNSPSCMSIEERLREPNINRVSENVVKSVNIAGDILDSYYSVLNSTKSNKVETHPPKPVVSQTTPKYVETSNKHYVSPDIKSRLLQTVVNNKTLANAASPVLNVDKSHELVTHTVSQISQRTVNTLTAHQAIPTNLISQSPVNSTIGSNPLSNMNSQNHVTNMQIDTDKGGPPRSYSQNTSHNISQHVNQASSMARPKSGTSMSPIEALLTGNTPSNVTANPYQLTQSPVSTPRPLTFPTIRTEISKPSNLISRQNVFDMFDSSENQMVTNDNSSRNTMPVKQLGAHSGLPSMELMKNIREKDSASVNYGSPLKTSSIMEALKFKLSQPSNQASQPKSSTNMNGCGVYENIASSVACVSSNPVVVRVFSRSPACSYSNPPTDSPSSNSDLHKCDPNDTYTQQSGAVLKYSSNSYDFNDNVVYGTKGSADDPSETLMNSNSRHEADHTDNIHTEKPDRTDDSVEEENREGKGSAEVVDSTELGNGTGKVFSEGHETLEGYKPEIPVHANSEPKTWTILDKVNISKADGKPFGADGDNSMMSKFLEGCSLHSLGNGTMEKWPPSETEKKQRNMYVIMIPTSNNRELKEAANSTLSHSKMQKGGVTSHDSVKKSRTSSSNCRRKRLPSRRNTFPPIIRPKFSACNKEGINVDEEAYSEDMKPKTVGKVYFQPSSSQIDVTGSSTNGLKRLGKVSLLQGCNSVKMCTSAPNMSADYDIKAKTTVNVRRRKTGTPRQTGCNDPDIEQSLNEVRVRQRATRITTNPIKTYQLCAKSHSQQIKESPKCLSLKDLHCVSRGGNAYIPYIRRQKHVTQSPNQTLKENNISYNTKQNSYLVRKCQTVDMTGNQGIDLDNSLTCDEEFFTSEVLSNLFPPNLGDGDSETDTVLKDIEHELFDLQDLHQTSQGQHWSSQTSILHSQFPHGAMVSMKNTNSVGNTPIFIQRNDQMVHGNVPVQMREHGTNQITSQHLNYGQTRQELQVLANYGQTAQQVQNSDGQNKQSINQITALPQSSTMNIQVISSSGQLSNVLHSQQYVQHETKDHTS